MTAFTWVKPLIDVSVGRFHKSLLIISIIHAFFDVGVPA